MSRAHRRAKGRRRGGWIIGIIAAAILLIGAAAAYFDLYRETEGQDYFLRAQSLFQQGDNKSAIIELKNALREDAKHAAARVLLGTIYLERGDGASAEKELAAAIELGVREPAVGNSLLRALLLQQRYEEVLSRLAALEAGSEDIERLLIRGHAFLGLGELEKGSAAFNLVLQSDPENSEARQALGKVALSKQDPVEAEKHIQQALAGSQADVEAWVLKGELEYSRGELEASKLAFETALQHSEKHLFARAGLVRTLLDLRQPDEALGHIDVLLAANPHNPVAHYMKALARYQKRDPHATLAALREVLQIAPDHAPSLLLAGRIHHDRGELEVAKELIHQYVRLSPKDMQALKLLGSILIELRAFDEAIAVLEPSVNRTPGNAQILTLLGSVYLAKGNYEKADEYLEQAAALQPNVAAIRTEFGLVQLISGERSRGLDELRQVVDRNPEFVRAEFILMLFHLRIGEFEEALTIGKKLAERLPENAVVQNLLGAAYEGRGDRKQARVHYQRAVELAVNYDVPTLNLARLDFADGDKEAAETRYRELLASDPDNASALYALSHLTRRDGRIDEAVSLLEGARRADPQAIAARVELAAYYLRKGDPHGAIEIMKEAASVAPERTDVQMMLARAYDAGAQFDEASSLYETLLKKFPERPNLWFQLGSSQANAGQADGARQSFLKAIELDPNHVAAKYALGSIAANLGDLHTALKIAKTIQSEHADQSVGHVLEGEVRETQGDNEQAIAAYSHAMGVAPNRAIAIKLATLHRREGNADQAFEVLIDWLTDHPEDVQARVALASAYQSEGHIDQALAHYEDVLARNATNVLALNNVAWIYFERNDERAMETAGRAYTEGGGRPQVADTYGWFLVQSGKIDQGLTLLRKAANESPSDATIQYHHATALALAGHESEAREQLQALLNQNRPFADREAARSLLEELQ